LSFHQMPFGTLNRSLSFEIYIFIAPLLFYSLLPIQIIIKIPLINRQI